MTHLKSTAKPWTDEEKLMLVTRLLFHHMPTVTLKGFRFPNRTLKACNHTMQHLKHKYVVGADDEDSGSGMGDSESEEAVTANSAKKLLPKRKLALDAEADAAPAKKNAKTAAKVKPNMEEGLVDSKVKNEEASNLGV